MKKEEEKFNPLSFYPSAGLLLLKMTGSCY